MLSKSKVKMGLNCPKALYLSVKKNHLAHYSADTKKSFAIGNLVGTLAQEKFPNGILINAYKNVDKEKKTKAVLDKMLPIFEGTFIHKQVVAQADILIPLGNNTWKMVEIKSGTSVKEDYLIDIAIQYYVLSKFLNLVAVELWHINKRSETVDQIFQEVDVLAEIKNKIPDLDSIIDSFLDLLNKEEPIQEIGPQCLSPYECAFKGYCWNKIPQEKTIFQLPDFSLRWEAYRKGVISIEDPRLVSEFNFPAELVSAIKENKLYVNQEELRNLLQPITMPVSFLDFECINYPLPVYPKTTPYMQLPFQYSLDVWEGKELDHKEFLLLQKEDPRIGFIKSLQSHLPSTGSIIVFDKSLEISVLKSIAYHFPEFKDFVAGLLPRIVDLAKVMKNNVYHPKFGSSFSLKTIVPVLCGEDKGYDKLIIKDGLEAINYYLKLIDEKDIIKKVQLSQPLREYSSADTKNLYYLLLFLKNAI